MKYKSKQKKMDDIIRGKNAEKEYAKLYSGIEDFNNIEFSTEKKTYINTGMLK